MSNLKDKAQALINALTGESRPHTVELAYVELKQAIADDGDAIAGAVAPSAEDLDAVAEEQAVKEATKPVIVARGKNAK